MVICLEQGADLHMAQLMPLPLTVSCSSKIQIGLPFWYRLTQVVLDIRPLNVCVCVCVRVSNRGNKPTRGLLPSKLTNYCYHSTTNVHTETFLKHHENTTIK